MPELPEVEVVRRGLHAHVVGHVVQAVRVTHPRSVRRHAPGADDLVAGLTGRQVAEACRRGKFLWLTFRQRNGKNGWQPTGTALVVHLGMSGQMLVQPASAPLPRHTHIVASLSGDEQLRFVDQRTFGSWTLSPLVSVAGSTVPELVAHIARDPLDPLFDEDAVVALLRRKHSEIKRVLLDQTVISGIGNIYADEALWRAGIHGRRLASSLTKPVLRGVLDAVRAVLADALAAGGTSFDALYVNVNGQSGYFDRSLAVYGRENQPCPRCGASIRREKFANRSSAFCPRCQPPPRARR